MPRCTNCNDTGWLRVGRVPERCEECEMMTNPTGSTLTATEQSQAVEREAAVPGILDEDQSELCDLIFNRVEASVDYVGGEPIAVLSDVLDAADAILAAGYRKRRDDLSGEKFLLPDDKAKRYSWEFVKHIAEKARADALNEAPAHRPPQPGVVTEDLREAAPDGEVIDGDLFEQVAIAILSGLDKTCTDCACTPDLWRGCGCCARAARAVLLGPMKGAPSPAAETAPDAGLVDAHRLLTDMWRSWTNGWSDNDVFDRYGKEIRAALSRAGERP